MVTFANNHIQPNWSAFIAFVQFTPVSAGKDHGVATRQMAMLIHVQQLTAFIYDDEQLLLNCPG
jgi:hypothetical protein